MWHAQVAALRAVGHRVIAPEVGGLGASRIPDGSPDVNAMAEQVVDAMGAAHIERAYVGGLSMGGYVAMAMLRVAPQHVGGLMLMDTKAAADDPKRRSTRLDIAAKIRSSESVATLARTMPATLVSDTSESARPGLRESVADQIRLAQPEATAWCQEAMASRPDSLTTLRSAGALPALVLCGSEDQVTPVADHEQLSAALRDAGGNPRLVVVSGAGHLPPLENPDAVSTALISFLET
jgi:pimeloyl-ACP methyl ester carboxylesterase